MNHRKDMRDSTALATSLHKCVPNPNPDDFVLFRAEIDAMRAFLQPRLVAEIYRKIQGQIADLIHAPNPRY